MEKCQYLSVAGAGQKGAMYAGGFCAFQTHIEKLGISFEEWRKQLKGVSKGTRKYTKKYPTVSK